MHVIDRIVCPVECEVITVTKTEIRCSLFHIIILYVLDYKACRLTLLLVI